MAYDPTALQKAQQVYDDAIKKAEALKTATLNNVSSAQASLINPYQSIADMYTARTGAIEAQTAQADLERVQREQAAQKTLESSNRGVYTTYKNAINPYGRMASQNNFSTGVSDYYKNASYGTMLQGLGANQYNYNDAMNNSNSLWQNYLAQKAGNEADALNDYNSAILAQKKYDKEQEDLEKERQQAIEQFNLNLKLGQEKLDRAKAQDEEDKRRWELEWARQQELDKQSSSGSGSGSGGSSRSGSNPGIEIPVEEPTTKTYNSTVGAQDPKKSVYVVSSKITASSIPGKAYKDIKYSDGTTKRMIVDAKPTVVTNKKTGGAAQIRNSAKSSSGYNPNYRR